ncbi:MAG TPA: hypothetical protein VLJ86_00720 [Ramlibacter sp.]|nr:hypothetical protein [Ramlibacter sp.]
MPTDSKSIPIGTPPVPDRVIHGLQAAIADPGSRPQAYIRLRASGGVRGEAYDFEFRIDVAGRTHTHLLDELNGRNQSTPVAIEAADPKRFVTLARALDIEALMRAEAPSGGFPPDSVVGRLEVSDGEQTATFLFLADEKQAERARRRAPDSLHKAVDAVFRAAATTLGADDVRP